MDKFALGLHSADEVEQNAHNGDLIKVHQKRTIGLNFSILFIGILEPSVESKRLGSNMILLLTLVRNKK